MRAPKSYKAKPFKGNDKWLKKYEKFQKFFDKDGDGIPDWLSSSAGASWKPNKAGWRSIRKEGVLIAKGIPEDLTLDEDTTTTIDLSPVKLRYFGKKKDILTIELAASEGTLEAGGNSKVSITGSGTGTLQLTGTRKDIDKFLNNTTAISYTGAEDDFGTNTASLALNVVKNGVTTTLGATEVNITDITDDLTGTAGNDTLTGDDGINTILGLAGNDYLYGLAGDDSIVGDSGNDTILGGAGADTLSGDAGEDVLQYAGSDTGVTIDLNADDAGFQQADGGDATGDVISGFEHVYGSDQSDMVTGNAEKNILFGYAGDDTLDGGDGDDVIRGGVGADVLTGGNGIDWLRYLGSDSGVTIDLNADEAGFQQADGGDATGDVISGFENVYGSDAGDTITGNAEENYILGYNGDDSIDGSAGNDTIRGGAGADTLNGGDDADVLQYAGSTSGVTIDLNADEAGFQQADGGDATGDVISGFEHVYATNFEDVLVGNGERNILYGYSGNDTLEGGDGKDVLRGGAGEDTFVFNAALEANNVDRIIDFSTGSDTIQIDSSVFTGLTAGSLDNTQFHINGTGLAEDATQRIIYNSDTGHLHFDSDGTGAEDGVVFATLVAGLSIDENDFIIV